MLRECVRADTLARSRRDYYASHRSRSLRMNNGTLGFERALGRIGASNPAMTSGSAGVRIDGPSRFAARIGGVLCVALIAGCAGIEPAPQREVPPISAPPDTTVSSEPKIVPTAPPPESLQVTGTERAAAASPMVTPAAPAARPAGQSAPKPDASTPKAPAKAPSPPPSAAQLPKKETTAPVIAKPAAPSPLDIKSLETRLKETKAIGVFTKLTLKNQVDDLLDQFRAYYQGRLKTSLAELRRSYDLLVLKVLALLQDADPPLANAIAASRESIWDILSDPAKFATV